MATDDFTDLQVDVLRRRWDEEPRPRLSLQLADLYRQRRELGTALSVLEQGIAAHPDHVSLKVALGRYRLEAEEPAEAAAVLERVVEDDPAHLVANKLLVRAYLGLEDSQRARDRLDLYAVLNDGDPDLPALRAAVGGRLFPAAEDMPPLPESFLGEADSGTAELGSLTLSRGRRLTGALDSEPFSALSEDPLEPTPIGALFGFDVVGDEFESWEELHVSALAEHEEASRHVEPAVEPPHEAARTHAARPLEPEPIEPSTGATATLGALYLAQGHVEDARVTFEQVLERDPADVEALAGLEEIERRSRLGAETPAATVGRHGGKVERLRRYLGRIRVAADRLSGRSNLEDGGQGVSTALE